MLAPRPDYDNLIHKFAFLYQAFDQLWRDIFAIRQLEQVLFSIGDVKMSAIVDSSNIAGLEPAVLEDLFVSVGMFKISLHDIFAADQDLPVICDTDFDTWKGQAHRSDAVILRPVGGNNACLCHPKSL